MKEGNYREAVEAYVNALKIDPEYLPAKNLEHLLKKRRIKTRTIKTTGRTETGGNRGRRRKRKTRRRTRIKRAGRERRTIPVPAGRTGPGGRGMNPEQIRNILRSMEKSPVRRQKGGSDEREEP